MKSENKFKNKLYELLKKDSRFYDDSLDEFNEILLKDLIDKLDEKLLEILLSDKDTKEKFFIKVKDVYVLKQNELKFFIDENKLDNSYTQYQNKIGLRVGNKLLSERNEVVLDWPFKDCVLEGGMTKEDQKRNEIFFNEVLAKDEIDRLEEPKVLVNWKRYNAKGEEKVKELKRDKEGTIRENLIIKGNNLLALHSLKEQFTGKVKLIYIDPPFNTGGDSFNYNDSFNHSSWLVFMKNRLEIARQLLDEDGSIFVHIDHNEAHYLKVMMDGIFGRDRFINEIIWCYTGPGSPGMRQFNRKHDNVFWYSKNAKWVFNSNDIRIDSEVHQGGFNNEMDASSSEGYEQKGKIPEDWWEFAVAARFRADGEKRTGYLTEKPYKLLERIIKATSNEGDIVLDFFAGSGTTAWVSSNLNRQFIAIEQLDETQKLLNDRLAKATAKNDEDFIFIELAKWNEEAKEKILKAKSLSELIKLFDKLYELYFLNYNLKIKEFREKTTKEEKFKELSLDEQKKLLIEMLDMNQMYVNFSERKDKKYNISKEDINLSEEFYNTKE